MDLFDAHCHLENPELFPRVEEVIASARHTGVTGMVTASTIPEEWPMSASLAARYPEVSHAVGIHPWFARLEHLELMPALAQAARNGAVAIGEIGLDAKIPDPPMDAQLVVFEAQLAVARELRLPVVSHCRGAFAEMLASFKRVGALDRGGMIHAFSGSMEIARECERFGLMISMGRSLTYRNSPKREAIVRWAWPDRLLLETDSPDMPPVELSGSINEPANLPHMLRAAAAILGETEEVVAARTTLNTRRFFGL